MKAGAGRLVFAAVLGLVGAALWAAYPRQPDLAAFDPDRMAAAETGMWRDYYNKRYSSLFYRLYGLNRTEFRFSPLDSFRIAYLAADAARRFQPTASRSEANAALPLLVSYYAVLSKAAPARFDPQQPAALELDWWQARRENVPAETYGLTIAKTSSLLYGLESAQLREAGIRRAQAMQYRDQHGGQMTEADWNEVGNQLLKSYQALKAAIAPIAPPGTS